jgi:invasion protein IalB
MAMKKLILALGLTAASLSPAFAEGEKVNKIFEEWQVNCETKAGKPDCVLYGGIANAQTKKVLVSIAVAAVAGGNKALIQVPTGILLTEGLSISFPGAAKPTKLAYKTCMKGYCNVELQFSEDWAKAFSGQPEVILGFAQLDAKPIETKISLKGFAEAYAYYQSQLKPS